MKKSVDQQYQTKIGKTIRSY